MRRRIQDLDFDEIVAKIANATNARWRKACYRIIQADLESVKSEADAVAMLRDHVMLAALHHAKTLDDVQFEKPLVQALVRVQHHPLADSIPKVKVQEGLYGPDAGPHLTQIVNEHPELTWDLDAIQQLIIRELRETHGDHVLDDAEPPWMMYWSPASAAADALIALTTLRTLGDIQ